MQPAADKHQTLCAAAIGLLLALVTFALFWPAVGHEFINYDDHEYVAANLRVQAGLTPQGVGWAFRTTHTGNWHPLTWLSLMLDTSLFGRSPAGYHFTNILLHAANAALLFALLRLATGSLWRSAIVAALFAWHPLHVESVAWIAERKDVLCAFFGFFSLLFYVRYAQSQIANRKSQIVNYALSLFLFACGLLSKPMLVTWPFLMLLLDWWPLRRLAIGDWRSAIYRLVGEKLPFFALTAASCVVTYLAQHAHKAVAPLTDLSIAGRLGNATLAYAAYLGKTFWPARLAVFYPLTWQQVWWHVALAVLLLAGLSGLALWRWRRQPYLFTGWFWFLGTLVPVIGLVQVGVQAMADRYTYLPLIGLFIALVWTAGEWAAGRRLPKLAIATLAVLALAACVWRTSGQLALWRDSETLFRHALAVTRDNYIAHLNLGIAQMAAGRVDAAIASYRESLRIKPDFGSTYNCLGIALFTQGRDAEAVESFITALRYISTPWTVRNNIGNVHLDRGRFDEAVVEYQHALRLKPDFIEAAYNLGRALASQGRNVEAIRQFQETLRFAPNYAPAHFQLGLLLAQTGDKAGALEHWRAAARLSPDWLSPLNSLAWVLATDSEASFRNGQEAVALAERAARLTRFRRFDVLDTLAAAYAENGRFAEAAQTAQKALELAGESGNEKLTGEIRKRLEAYQTGRPWREP